MGLKKCLSITARVVIALWIIAQIIDICTYWGKPQYSDAANYLRFAQEAAAASSWYPTAEMFNHNAWIANTGYINLLVLNLKLFGNTLWVGPQQLILNLVLLLSFAKIIRSICGGTTACVAAILFCLIPSNTLAVAGRMSDIPCIALLMLSFAVIRPDWRYIFLSGMIAALANWIRPIGMMYWPSLILFAIYKHAPVKDYISYVAGCAVIMAGIMALTYSTCGYPLSGSTTKGTNMIQGCWDGATGKYDDLVFLQGNPGYIASELDYNAVQRDSCLSARSTEWIMSNPVRFVSLIPKKLFYLWAHDAYPEFILTAKPDKRMPHQFALSFVYYLVLALSVWGLWLKRRDLLGMSGIVLLPVVLGCGAHILMYGGGRYHYPLLPPLVYFAAIAITYCLNKRNPQDQALAQS